jgi:hypothetical protein
MALVGERYIQAKDPVNLALAKERAKGKCAR